MSTKPIDYVSLAKQHGAIHSAHESDQAAFPPELERIRSAVGIQFGKGPPNVNDKGESAVASVGVNEPHLLEINDPVKFAQAPVQTTAHELVHLYLNQLPGKLREAIPPDDPKHPYDISKADEWRAQGKKLWQLPQEVAATLIQRWVAMPQERARLQPWIDDLRSAPLSVVNPTAPNSPDLVTSPRPPIPPIEGYLSPQEMRARGAALQAKLKSAGITK